MADVADIVTRLETIAEELADRAIDALRDAIDHGETRRPDLERRLTRARSSVERAIALLRDTPAPTAPDE